MPEDESALAIAAEYAALAQICFLRASEARAPQTARVLIEMGAAYLAQAQAIGWIDSTGTDREQLEQPKPLFDARR